MPYVRILKLTFRKYPAIHTNCIISHCTTLRGTHIVYVFPNKQSINQYNHNIYTARTLEHEKITNSTVLSFFYF